MVLLEGLKIRRQVHVVQKVVCAVVHDVAQEGTCKASIGPVVREESKCKKVEGGDENDAQSGGKNQSHLVHGEVVVDAMEQEMECVRNLVSGEVVIEVEGEPVESVLDEGPHKQTKGKHGDDAVERQSLGGQVDAVEVDGDPQTGNDEPGGLGERLEDVSEDGRTSVAVMSGLVDLFQVELLGPLGAQHLHQQGFVEVQELVGLVVSGEVSGDSEFVFGVLFQLEVVSVFSGEQLGLLFGGSENSHQIELVQHLVGSLRVLVGHQVAHNLRHVFTGKIHNQVSSSGVLLQERRHIVDLEVVDGHVARALGVVALHLFSGEKGQIGHGVGVVFVPLGEGCEMEC